MMPISQILSELDYVIIHSGTYPYIHNKTSYFLRIIVNKNFSPEITTRANQLEVILKSIPNPYDWNKNVKSYNDLESVLSILNELYSIFEQQ